jgi:prephenate dehydratase
MHRSVRPMSDPLRVAFQGEHGAFSEEAARSLLGATVVTVPRLDFAGVADAVRSGAADRGVLPIENSIHGSVTAAYDVLAGGDFTVLARTVRPIRLCLAGLHRARLTDVRRVISHPVALDQCQRLLRELRRVDVVATHDTAGAAREVAWSGDPTLAAVASRPAAERYGLRVLRDDVQDRPDNQTRFLLIGRADGNDSSPRLPSGGKHLLLLIDVDDSPGSLVHVLAPLAAYGIDIRGIQPRPAAEPWAYRFFIEVAATAANESLAARLGAATDAEFDAALDTDFDAALDTALDEALDAALDEMRQRAVRVATLGRYD